MKCPKCGTEMKYFVIYNFGDPSFGIGDEWYRCPNCRRIEPLSYTKKQDYEENNQC